MAQIKQVNIRIKCPFCRDDGEHKVDVAITGTGIENDTMAHYDGFTIVECQSCEHNIGVDLHVSATVRK